MDSYTIQIILSYTTVNEILRLNVVSKMWSRIIPEQKYVRDHILPATLSPIENKLFVHGLMNDDLVSDTMNEYPNAFAFKFIGACSGGHLELVKKLMVLSKAKTRGFVCACINGHYDIVKFLFDKFPVRLLLRSEICHIINRFDFFNTIHSVKHECVSKASDKELTVEYNLEFIKNTMTTPKHDELDFIKLLKKETCAICMCFAHACEHENQDILKFLLSKHFIEHIHQCHYRLLFAHQLYSKEYDRVLAYRKQHPVKNV